MRALLLGAYLAYQQHLDRFLHALILHSVALFVMARWLALGLGSCTSGGPRVPLLLHVRLSYIIVELVQVLWGRQRIVAYPRTRTLESGGRMRTSAWSHFPEYECLMAAAIAMCWPLSGWC